MTSSNFIAKMKIQICLLALTIVFFIWSPNRTVAIFAVLVMVIYAIQLFIHTKHKAVGVRANDQAQNKKFPCQLSTKSEYCCIREYQNYLTNNSLAKIRVSDKFFNRYRLLSKEDMAEREQHFGQITDSTQGKKEVWIFSHDLRTEVSNDGFQDIAATNVNNGVKYVYFYMDKVVSRNIVNQNMTQIRNKIHESKQNSQVIFVPISDIQNNTEKMNLLPSILGSIVLIDRSLPDEEKQIEAYFSLRKNPQGDEPIYFKMPRCMRNAFHKYFEGLMPMNIS